MRHGGSTRTSLLLPLGGCGEHVSPVLSLAGHVQGKPVTVGAGYGVRPFQPTAACREGRERARRRSHVPRHRLSGRSPLQARLAGRPNHVMISLPSAVDVAVGRAWSIPWPRSSSGQEIIGTAAPPMMVSGQQCIWGEVERERAHPRWRARSGHRNERSPSLV